MVRTFKSFCAAAALIGVLAPVAAHAQYRASIRGVVTDTTGAIIPDATLTLTDTSTNLTLNAKSDAHGNYTFNALPADSFQLVVTAHGFGPKTLSGVTLIPEQANTVNVKLAVGSTSESVNVDAGEATPLDTATASISGTVTNNQIQHLPSFDRDVFRLVALAPGTFGDGAQSNGGNAKNMPGEDHAGPAATDGGIFETENNPQVIGNGSQVSANNILIDGISTSSANWGGASVITPSEESVEYLKVTSNAYDAEFGRFSGNAVQITSKSGTNSYHGSAFFKADRPGLNAYQRWNGQNSNDPINAGKSPAIRNLLRDQTRFNQFGGSVGGPFWRNKLFGFFAYEGFRNGSSTIGSGLYETPTFLASAPAGSIAAKYAAYPGESALSTIQSPASCAVNYGIADGPYCKTLANGTLDIGSPLKTALGNYDTTWASKTKPGIGAGLDGVGDLQLLSTTNPVSNVGDQYNGRLDADVTAKDRLSFIIYWVPFSTQSINGANRAANQYNHQQINNAFTALYNRTISSTLLNEARASASGWRWNEVTSNPQVPFGLPIDSFVGVGNGTQPQNFGPPNPSIFNQWTYAYQDIATKVAGRHNIKAGATFTNIQFLQEVVGNARPAFTFNSFWDFLNDAPFTETANFNPTNGLPGLNRQDERMNIFGTFAQDDFKVTPTLTLNLGLRWNYFGPFHNKQNNLSIVTPGAGSALITGLTMTQGGNLYKVQKSNYGPQVGFAWNPEYLNRKVVFRGGFGVNYNENEFAITAQGNANSPTLLGFSQTGYSSKNPAILYNTAGDIHTPLAYPSNPKAITSFGSNGLPTAAGLSVQVTGFDQNVKTITVFHYSLDTEMALAHNFVATLGYQGSSGHHLLYQEDLNAVAVVKGYALNPALSRVMVNVNGANSNYNAMLATIKHNFSHSFQIEGQYTWSKSMDEGSSPYTVDPYAPISIHSAYGRSDYNVQNAFRTFGLYQPSFFHEKYLHAIADGWSLGGIYNWHSGFPWNPVYSVTTNGVPTGPSGNLYYPGSPYSSIRPASYTGTGLVDTSTVGFESGPTLSSPAARNVNFPNGGAAYFTEPTYTAAAKVAYNPALTYGAPSAAIARNSFTGSMYQDLDASLAKAFRLPEGRVIGNKAALEIRVDAYNVFNLTNLTPTPTTNITSLTFGAATSALGSRSVQIQARLRSNHNLHRWSFMTTRRSFLVSAAAAAALTSRPLKPWSQAPSGPSTIDLIVDPSTTLATMPMDFTGLSYESAQLGHPEFFSAGNKAMIGLINTMGPRGVLRIGGNTEEYTRWSADDADSAKNLTPAAIGPDAGSAAKTASILTPKAIRNLKAFIDQTGWRIIYGLDLRHGTVENAAAEAKYVASVLGPKLIAFQIGNEPDMNHADGAKDRWTFEFYWTLWQQYRDAVSHAVPSARFAGPDIAKEYDWITKMAEKKPDIEFLTGHYYAEGPPANPRMTLEYLLQRGNNPATEEIAVVHAATKMLGKPYRMAEGNTCFHGGKPGVSNTFASALWSGDYMLQLAQAGYMGLNLHGGGQGLYTPIAGDLAQGFTARPVYYGALLAERFAGATFVTTTLSAQSPDQNVTAFAASHRSAWKAAIFNKASSPVSVRIAGLASSTRAAVTLLQGKQIESMEGVTFGGSVVGPAGEFSPKPQKSLALRQGSGMLELPGYTAAVIEL